MTMTENKIVRKLIIASENEATIKAIEDVLNFAMPINGERVDIKSFIPNLIPNSFSLVFTMNRPWDQVFVLVNAPDLAKGIAIGLGDNTLTIEEAEVEIL